MHKALQCLGVVDVPVAPFCFLPSATGLCGFHRHFLQFLPYVDLAVLCEHPAHGVEQARLFVPGRTSPYSFPPFAMRRL